MICLCSCSGVSTSTLEIGRKQTTTASCKACGGKPLVNGRGSSSNSMPGAFGLELTSFINSDLTWTKITKGNRSSSRRARKSLARSLKNIGELVNKDPKSVEMPVSESEKLGVSVLGCRFSEKAEHVPIKKRRFLFRSPSPPPRTFSPCSEEAELLLKYRGDLHPEFHRDSFGKSQPVAIVASMNDLGQMDDNKLDIDAKNLVRADDKLDESEDFSGISILAAAACNCFGGDDVHAEEASGMEESFVDAGTFEGSMNNGSCLVSKEVSKEQSSAEISKEGNGSCISIMPAEELAASSRAATSSSNCRPHGHGMEGTSMQDLSMATSKDILSEIGEGAVRMQDSSSRDDRLHWDLNTEMDAWERPFNYQNSDHQTNVDIVANSTCSDSVGNSEGHPLPEIRSDKCDAEKATSTNLGDTLEITQQSDMVEQNFDACTDAAITICLQKQLLSSVNDCEPVSDIVKGTESLHTSEDNSPNSASVDLVPADNAFGPETSASGDRNAVVQCVAPGSSGTSESLSLHHVGSLDLCSEMTRPTTDHCTSMCVSEGNINRASVDAASIKRGADCTAGVHTCDSIPPSAQVEKQDIAFSPIALPSNATCENGDVTDENAECAEATSCLDNSIAPTNLVSLETSQPQESEPSGTCLKNFSCKSDEVGPSTSSPMCIEMPSSGVLVEGQPTVVVDKTVQQSKVSIQENAESGSKMHLDGEELKLSERCAASLHSPSHDSCLSYPTDIVNISDKVSPEKPLENDYGSDLCHVDGHLVGIEEVSELEEDYDSQYEDGEVRESILHAWEDHRVEDIEGENMDYGSDNANTLGCEGDQLLKKSEDSSFQPHPSDPTEVIKARSGKENVVKTTTPFSRGQLTGKDVSNVVGTSDNVDNKVVVGTDKVTRNNEIDARGDGAGKEIQSGSLSMKVCHKNPCDVETGVRDGSSWKKTDGDCVELDAEDTEARIAEGVVFKRDLRSRIEGRTSRDVCFVKEKLSVQGSRCSDADDSNPRLGRESGSIESFGRGGYSRHSHSRGRGGDRWFDSPESRRGPKRNHSPSYHGPMAFRHLGPENGIHRSFRRSGSPVGREEAFGIRGSARPAREISPYRRLTLGRGRSVRYGPQVDGRGSRGRYHASVSSTFRESSFNHSHPSARRERSFSPVERRGATHAHQSCAKSPSRSRTRSPISGSSGFRHRSKSPTFRSEIGMQRLRSPHQRPGFLADHVAGFRSVRGRSSPTHNSRWIEDRRDGLGHFREHGYNQRASVLDRRSPGRFGPRDDRYDLVDAPRSYRSLHPGRLSEMDGVGRGSLRYDERRKPVYKYRSGNLVARNDMDGPIKRFRYNVEDDFVAGRSRFQDDPDFHSRWNPTDYNRGMDNRIGDIPRRSGEGGPYEYQRNGKYDVKSSTSAMREDEEDSSPRKRPS
ncbi:hypothetical protein CJ030_MR4G025268 [Morella rubra]|uniref:Uncharacterized protein n=1 Tax=Morella rubra TaxID=262757 RepID=A0A6A1VQY9_9ROSI|nr:hypothetical protein CJ030_MR4G025268 [Morella rubra]